MDVLKSILFKKYPAKIFSTMQYVL